MNVRDEIEDFSSDEHKDILHWLFDRYPTEAQWHFVAKATHKRYGTQSYQTNRVWSPTEEGLAIHSYMNS